MNVHLWHELSEAKHIRSDLPVQTIRIYPVLPSVFLVVARSDTSRKPTSRTRRQRTFPLVCPLATDIQTHAEFECERFHCAIMANSIE